MRKLSWLILFLSFTAAATAQKSNVEGSLDSLMQLLDHSGAPDITELPADRYVHDPAELLPQAERQRLEEGLRRYEADSTVRLWVVLVPKTPGFIFSSYKLKALAENWPLTKEKPKRWAVLFISAKGPVIKSLFAEYLDAPVSPLREVFIEEALVEKNYAKAVNKGLGDMKHAIADGLYDTDRIPDLRKPKEIKNIYDFSRLLPDEQEAELDQLLRSFEAELEADWTVILVPNLPDTTNLARMKKVIVKRWGLEQREKPWLLFFMHTDREIIELAGHASFEQAASATTAARLENFFPVSFSVTGLKQALVRYKEVAESGSYEQYEVDALGPVPTSGSLLWTPIIFIAINLLFLSLYRKYWDSSDWPRFLILIFGPPILVYVLAHQLPFAVAFAAYIVVGLIALYRIGARGQYLSQQASLKGREEIDGWGGKAKPSQSERKKGGPWA